jgi:hypothetical protein
VCDGIAEEFAVGGVFRDDDAEERSDGSVGRRGGGWFGGFVESNFFNANQVTDIKAGDEFLGQLGREWVVWGEGGVEGFDGIEDLEG